MDVTQITAVTPPGAEEFDLLRPLALLPQLLSAAGGDLTGGAGQLLPWLGQRLLYKVILSLLVVLPSTKQSWGQPEQKNNYEGTGGTQETSCNLKSYLLVRCLKS